MKISSSHENYMSEQEFISEFAHRLQTSIERANDIMAAILEILDKNDNESVHLDAFDIQLIKQEHN